jgi:hypothetical protein
VPGAGAGPPTQPDASNRRVGKSQSGCRINRQGSGTHGLRTPWRSQTQSVGHRAGSLEAHPFAVQFGAGLTRAALLGLAEHLPINSHLALEHTVDGPPQVRRQEAQGLALVMCVLQAGEKLLALGVVTQTAWSRCGKGPFAVRMTNLLA